MDFLNPAVAGRVGPTTGSIDYRLARRRVLRAFREGETTREEICDAQRELLRVAEHASVPAGARCPVCSHRDLRLVRFVFGPRLPSGGRAITSERELARLANRSGEHRCYAVEVCTACRWNHLQQTYLLGAELSA